MNTQQHNALTFHCRLAVETIHPRFSYAIAGSHSIVLTINSGYE